VSGLVWFWIQLGQWIRVQIQILEGKSGPKQGKNKEMSCFHEIGIFSRGLGAFLKLLLFPTLSFYCGIKILGLDSNLAKTLELNP
jgi:hypothetical protein